VRLTENSFALVDRVERRRLVATRSLSPERRSALGQFMTPRPVAGFMASLFHRLEGDVRVLDAGAGVGSLLAAFTAEALGRTRSPRSIHATAFELDPALAVHLRRTAGDCREYCGRTEVRLTHDIVAEDFIQAAVAELERGKSCPTRLAGLTHALLNPPYKKLDASSPARTALRRVGIETPNLYTAFLGLSILLLSPGAELVAITPRSYCNGRYYRPFRELLLREMSLERVHVFESRTAAFAEDRVLQETVVIHAVKRGRGTRVVISSSVGPGDESMRARSVPRHAVVRAADPESFIRVVPDASGDDVTRAVLGLPCRLDDLGLAVSTGKVVDFRARDYLCRRPGPRIGPLVYPAHFQGGVVAWPKSGKKPNGLLDAPETAELWMPAGAYVLVKRFSSKEERRRVVAAVFDPSRVPGEKVAFENHLNVFHRNGAGLPRTLARGLSVFLNSTLVDAYFRQFNGHTQVNATDLRNLRYPSTGAIERLGRRVADSILPQHELDPIVHEALGVTRRRARRASRGDLTRWVDRDSNPGPTD
jgi:adenine-specific DNA-methyltransferase